MKNQNIVIRPYAPETDLKKLSRIWLDASLIAHSFIGEQTLFEQRKLIEDQYLPNAETWLACINDQPCGFMSLLETFVAGIFVSPDRQGLGIGRQLIAHALTLQGELGRVDKPDPTSDRRQLREAEKARLQLVVAGSHAA